jgi:hypothetical protein
MKVKLHHVSHREKSDVRLSQDFSPYMSLVACIYIYIYIYIYRCAYSYLHICVARGNINKFVIILGHRTIANDDPRNRF